MRTISFSFALLAGLLLAGTVQAEITGNKIRIGVLTDLSGGYEQNSGNGSVEATRMAVEAMGGKINGATIEIVAGVIRNQTRRGRGAANRWFDVDQIDMVTDLVNSASRSHGRCREIEENKA
jgi:branched-chain amino acid transport system substrate-binding protein